MFPDSEFRKVSIFALQADDGGITGHVDEFSRGGHAGAFDQIFFLDLPRLGAGRANQNRHFVGLEIRQQVIGHIAGGGPHVRDDPLFSQINAFI
jgi:hypothetical protein